MTAMPLTWPWKNSEKVGTSLKSKLLKSHTNKEKQFREMDFRKLTDPHAAQPKIDKSHVFSQNAKAKYAPGSFHSRPYF